MQQIPPYIVHTNTHTNIIKHTNNHTHLQSIYIYTNTQSQKLTQTHVKTNPITSTNMTCILNIYNGQNNIHTHTNICKQQHNKMFVAKKHTNTAH